MIRAVELIAAKRRGETHRPGEVRALIDAYMRDEVPDYQVSAWLMAVCWRGLSDEETTELTLALADSGRRLRFDGSDRPVVDKHSTGGVGDKTTLVLAPMLVAAGAVVAKMSGRGLGHTGGTIDKLEAIPGVTTTTDADALVAAVRRDGIAVAAQSPDLAPADGRLYALRDVTATVESIPLIASSVMSKKIATGANAVVLDVKAGSGAFMKEADAARDLARAMVALGRGTGLPTVAVISSMDAPLGRTIGNALEVREAIETLRGGGPAELAALCVALGAEVLTAAGAGPQDAASERLRRTLADGCALGVLRRLVGAMGGDVRCIDEPDRLPRAARVVEVKADRAGYVAAIDALRCGEVAMRLGAGRATKRDAIDPAVGLVLRVSRGDSVRQSDPLVDVHCQEEPSVDLLDALRAAFSIHERAPAPAPLILDVIR
ncbi:MAG TPA: thymidine phosphorylase, partial [Chloroflexota bacterium]|nr:thymidine phosphorylase [Chloroflexota bacterium]